MIQTTCRNRGPSGRQTPMSASSLFQSIVCPTHWPSWRACSIRGLHGAETWSRGELTRFPALSATALTICTLPESPDNDLQHSLHNRMPPSRGHRLWWVVPWARPCYSASRWWCLDCTRCRWGSRPRSTHSSASRCRRAGHREGRTSSAVGWLHLTFD